MTKARAVNVLIGITLNNVTVSLSTSQREEIMEAVSVTLAMLADTQTGAEETASDSYAGIAIDTKTAINTAESNLASLVGQYPWPF